MNGAVPGQRYGVGCRPFPDQRSVAAGQGVSLAGYKCRSLIVASGGRPAVPPVVSDSAPPACQRGLQRWPGTAACSPSLPPPTPHTHPPPPPVLSGLRSALTGHPSGRPMTRQAIDYWLMSCELQGSHQGSVAFTTMFAAFYPDVCYFLP